MLAWVLVGAVVLFAAGEINLRRTCEKREEAMVDALSAPSFAVPVFSEALRFDCFASL